MIIPTEPLSSKKTVVETPDSRISNSEGVMLPAAESVPLDAFVRSPDNLPARKFGRADLKTRYGGHILLAQATMTGRADLYCAGCGCWSEEDLDPNVRKLFGLLKMEDKNGDEVIEEKKGYQFWKANEGYIGRADKNHDGQIDKIEAYHHLGDTVSEEKLLAAESVLSEALDNPPSSMDNELRERVQSAVVEALKKIIVRFPREKTKRTMEILIKATDAGSHIYVYKRALEALRELGEFVTLVRLKDTSTDTLTSSEAERQLEKIEEQKLEGLDPISALAEGFHGSESELFVKLERVVSKLGEKAVPLLIKVFKSNNNPEVPRAMVRLLKGLREKAVPAVPVLIDEVKSAVARVGSVKLRYGINNPFDSSDDQIEDMRRLIEAIKSTMKDIGEGAVPELTGVLEDPNWDVRAYFAEFLGYMGKQAVSALPTLMKKLSDKNVNLREQADMREQVVNALGNIAPSSPMEGDAVTALTKALADPSTTVQYAGCAALEKFGEKALPAVPALVSLFGKSGKTKRGEGEDVGGAAAEAVSAIGKGAIPFLNKALQSQNPRVRKNATYAFDTIKRNEARIAAPALIEALGKGGDPEKLKASFRQAIETVAFLRDPDRLKEIVDRVSRSALKPEDKISLFMRVFVANEKIEGIEREIVPAHILMMADEDKALGEEKVSSLFSQMLRETQRTRGWMLLSDFPENLKNISLNSKARKRLYKEIIDVNGPTLKVKWFKPIGQIIAETVFDDNAMDVSDVSEVFRYAVQSVRAMDGLSSRARAAALEGMVTAMAEKGLALKNSNMLKEALGVARTIDYQVYQAEALAEVAFRMARMVETLDDKPLLDQALKIARSLNYSKSHITHEIALKTAKLGRLAKNKEMLGQSIEMAASQSDFWNDKDSLLICEEIGRTDISSADKKELIDKAIAMGIIGPLTKMIEKIREANLRPEDRKELFTKILGLAQARVDKYKNKPVKNEPKAPEERIRELVDRSDRLTAEVELISVKREIEKAGSK